MAPGTTISNMVGGSETSNSWTLTVTVSSADFVSVMESEALAPRQADGNLPNMSFLRLVMGSDLIDKGENVGLPFSGTAPDLGPFEFGLTAGTGGMGGTGMGGSAGRAAGGAGGTTAGSGAGGTLGGASGAMTGGSAGTTAGTATGGSAGVGGTAAGGTDVGGAPTGGTATGGTSTGGGVTGGTATGGAATGGAATGGSATGGAPATGGTTPTAGTGDSGSGDGSDEPGGCGCRTSAPQTSPLAILASLLTLCALGARRRGVSARDGRWQRLRRA
jgi:MYXO-CTERM domain-containing protein